MVPSAGVASFTAAGGHTMKAATASIRRAPWRDPTAATPLLLLLPQPLAVVVAAAEAMVVAASIQGAGVALLRTPLQVVLEAAAFGSNSSISSNINNNSSSSWSIHRSCHSAPRTSTTSTSTSRRHITRHSSSSSSKDLMIPLSAIMPATGRRRQVIACSMAGEHSGQEVEVG